ncbi:MAG: ATP synthase subunit C [Oscillospiraceae bacterium]|jgi:V/A-type H+-transporting ATPase subunit K|nr:ATP synthase subunit C [Oscillospiraceae bacterium]
MNTLEILLLPLMGVALISVPFIGAYQKKKGLAKAKTALIWNIVSCFAILVLGTIMPVGELVALAAEGDTGAEVFTTGKGLAYLAAGIATGIGSIGCGIAVAGAAPAAIGASAEDPKSFSKSLIFVALGEGVALYGFLISFLIVNKL